jgi:hypothetical protein
METQIHNDKPRPIAQIDANEAALAKKYGWIEAPYSPPTERFYLGNYILDSCVTADLLSSYGYFRRAAKQLNSFRSTQRENGMVPGTSFPPQSFTINPERLMSSRPFESVDYSQSPVWAYSVHKLYKLAQKNPAIELEQQINPDLFLEDIYPSLRRYYDYFIDHRQISAYDPRVFLVHPHEGNRDSSPEYDQWKLDARKFLPRIPRTSEHMPLLVNKYNRIADYLGSLAINYMARKYDHDPARIREEFEFVDTWYNVLLQENYGCMSELAGYLGRVDEAEQFATLADRLEKSILSNHYFPDARAGQGAFYSIYNGQPTGKSTNGTLTAFLLPNLTAGQLESKLKLLKSAFNTPYPLPSVATDDTENYDPHYEEEDRHWRTPKWVVADHIIMRGLAGQLSRNGQIPERLKSGCQEWFHKIHQSNLAVVEDVEQDYFEHNSPVDGRGQRKHRTRGHIFGAAAHIPI